MTDPCDSSGGSQDEPAEDRPPRAVANGVVAACALNLEIVGDDGDWQPFGDIECAVTATAHALARRVVAAGGAAAATVVLSSDAQVARLNETYRGTPKPTNVLSFPAGPPAGGLGAGDVRFLGDVILAAETVRAEAEAQGIPLLHHVQHLVVHGVLHLAGLDHETDAAADHMEAEEIAILATLGIADPYADPTPNDEETERAG